MSNETVIVYRYDTSPYSQKIDHVLALKNIPHEHVDVSVMLPRPEITDQLGINYRRIPILAIGNDVYCDTGLIAPTLERRFPPSARHGTIYPAPKHSEGTEGATKGGLVTAFSKFYTDNVLFPLIVSVLPWEASPPAFIADRAKLLGGPINLEQYAEGRPSSISLFSSHLLLLEEQLSDSREWLSDTKALSLTDISVHFLLAWGRRMPTVASLFDESRFPLTIAWLDRVSAAITALKATQTPPSKLSGETAARKIVSAPHEPYDVVGFDTIEAMRLGVGLGDTVQVAPDDYGKDYPTNGKLVALSRSELTLEVQGSEGLLRCHFPRLGYVVKRASV